MIAENLGMLVVAMMYMVIELALTHSTLQAPLGSLSTQPAQDHVTTGTEPDTGRLLLTQQTWLPQLSTRLDCSGSALAQL